MKFLLNSELKYIIAGTFMALILWLISIFLVYVSMKLILFTSLGLVLLSVNILRTTTNKIQNTEAQKRLNMLSAT
ncbi:MAG: hypothetical protein IT257_06185 [Chitinophagaceae bacterium]|nr:hypothetical protein [Chitinophagaceae bacterium]